MPIQKNKRRIKLLIVAFSDSIHTARWIEQIDSEKIDIHLFPSVAFKSLHPKIKNITVYIPDGNNDNNDNSISTEYFSIKSWALTFVLGKQLGRRVYGRLNTMRNRVRELDKAVKKIKPHLLHSFETQHAGYLVTALEERNSCVPFWIHSTWGIDLHYFQSMPEDRPKLEKLLSRINLLITEGERDTMIAAELGYKGETKVLQSVGGGFNFSELDKYSNPVSPSGRKRIIIKGYEGGERKAGIVIKALRKIKDVLAGFEVFVYSCNNILIPEIEEIQQRREFNIKIIGEMNYTEMLEFTASARLSITNNLSDGVPNTMLEAMAFGVFPIQSNTAITEGWIEDGFNGLLTEPENTNQIAEVLRRAIADDVLIERAATYNMKLVRDRLNLDKMSAIINSMYLKAAGYQTN